MSLKTLPTHDIVIVAPIQRYPFFRECLKSLSKCNFGDRVVNVHIGIVDDEQFKDVLNYPTKMDLNFLKEINGLKIHYFKENHYPKNLNHIFRQCSGDYVIKVDDDVVFEDKEWLIKYENVLTSLNLGFVAMANRRKIIDSVNGIGLCEIFTGSVMMISRIVIDKIGYWNEGYGPFLWEDLDYKERARISGFKFKYICRHSDCGVKMYHCETFPSCPEDYKKLINNSGKYLYQNVMEMKDKSHHLIIDNFKKYEEGIGLYCK